jgi:hypothetical protein
MTRLRLSALEEAGLRVMNLMRIGLIAVRMVHLRNPIVNRRGVPTPIGALSC